MELLCNVRTGNVTSFQEQEHVVSNLIYLSISYPDINWVVMMMNGDDGWWWWWRWYLSQLEWSNKFVDRLLLIYCKARMLKLGPNWNSWRSEGWGLWESWLQLTCCALTELNWGLLISKGSKGGCQKCDRKVWELWEGINVNIGIPIGRVRKLE